jgi:hypothetical protein
MLDTFITQRAQINSLEQSLSGAEQDRSDCNVQLINEGRAKVLLNCIGPASEAHVFPIRGFTCPVERLVDSASDEAKGRIPLHHDRPTRVMREDEDWDVIGRILTPPSLPIFIGPWPPDGPEHVSAQNPCADVVEPARCTVIIDTSSTVSGAEEYLLKGTRRERPRVKFGATNSEWVVYALVLSCAVAIEGHCEAFDSESCHVFPKLVGNATLLVSS